MIAKKTRSRRRAIVTPTKKAPANRKVSRKEVARIKANQGAKKKAARLFPEKGRGNKEGNDDEGGLTDREKSRKRAAQWAQAVIFSPKKDPGKNGENKGNKGGLTEREKSRRHAAEWAKDQRVKKAQNKNREATAAVAATPRRRPRGDSK